MSGGSPTYIYRDLCNWLALVSSMRSIDYDPMVYISAMKTNALEGNIYYTMTCDNDHLNIPPTLTANH